MRSILVLAVLGLLAGCSMISAAPQAWDWDPATNPRVAAADARARATAYAGRLADLRVQRQDIRARIAAEPDIRQRQALYAQLHQIGLQLSPLERRYDSADSVR